MKYILLIAASMVLFATSSAHAQASFYVSSTNNNVGIGTTNPIAPLEIYNATQGFIQIDGGGNPGLNWAYGGVNKG
ncbi:MAG: hypothetical protein KGJ13_11850, partial [Patescibacteria group bacterium]|nr:hypothetical protein [Patescibacteria group bacterium]